ncbi:hypothetical protein CY34DRAFT_26821 [Suillus luteus UH-Slu-Lm8-n1]|uniref:DNA 3'-5' helicase n=1 Tax=Suillus luteus UH-Slu-Lm8-n1 TaxID=930992 RepID=A0A0D0ARI7_9AGAM|nr:hypothetical protein CY34DRAFT_26821 [Suillus luteus UH-Slu-Lm8-n1]
MKVAKAFLQKDHDIVCIAGTSLGKTMSFWLPLLWKKGLQIVVTPLNQLGKQNVNSLAKAGCKDIEDLKYLVIIVSPEQLMKPGGEFERLLHKPEFALQIIGFICDEAHCITSWGEFHPEYKELQWLCHILPCYVPFMMASATLAPSDLSHAKRLLCMRTENLVTIKTSIDCFNIKLCVRKIKHSLASFQDLGFLIPDRWKNTDPIPPKFLIFFDSIQDAMMAAKSLQSRLTSGETWGLCTTESFRMGMNIPDITMVIQWRATCKLSTLWQRWGHAARDWQLQGTAVLFAEEEYFNDVQQERHERQDMRKRKADNKSKQDENEGIDGNEHGGSSSRGGNAGNGDSELHDIFNSTMEEKTRVRKKNRELDPTMDCLINTHLHDIIQSPDHITCDPSLLQGCLCCAPVPPDICCNIHHPNAFLFFDTIIPTLPKLPQHSRLPKHSTMGLVGYELCGTLEDWWEAATLRVYGDSNLRDYGPSAVMPDSVLDRIVDCVQHHKIVTIQDLCKETRWSGSDKFGADIIVIIHRLFPVPTSTLVLTLAPLQRQLSSVNNSVAPPSNPQATSSTA